MIKRTNPTYEMKETSIPNSEWDKRPRVHNSDYYSILGVDRSASPK